MQNHNNPSAQSDVLTALADVLETRKQADTEQSYVASLYAKGLNKILEKVGEEATETILAAKDCHIEPNATNTQALISETADLWFHTLVMLAHLEQRPETVLQELNKRFGLSGLIEKAQRKAP